MKINIILLAGLALVFTTSMTAASSTAKDAPIQISGIREWPSKNTGDKLLMAAGISTSTVFRSNRENPELSDGLGWTFQHHPGMAAWRGLLYVAWDSGEKDEDTWPARQLFSTSNNGSDWSKPRELFPQGTSTPLRMWFYRASNDVMLAIAGLRTSNGKTIEKNKSGLVARRINTDHSLGEVHVLRQPASWREGSAKPKEIFKSMPSYDKCADAGFVRACELLLADHTFLMQQDFGNLMDMQDRMSWAQPSSDWSALSFSQKERESFAKAFSFYKRGDGAITGIGKGRFVVVSTDGGRTWSAPAKPPTLVTGNAKVWSQRTADGRYALVYNPHPGNRYPLVVVSGDDGVNFKDMCAVNPGTEPQRYEGKNKNTGAQYVRGIDEWSSDGSWKDSGALWVVYSMNKEDILVSRIPLPVTPDRGGEPVNAARTDG